MPPIGRLGFEDSNRRDDVAIGLMPSSGSVAGWSIVCDRYAASVCSVQKINEREEWEIEVEEEGVGGGPQSAEQELTGPNTR